MDFEKIFPDEESRFCGSGTAYKDCHKVKIYQHIGEILHEQRQFILKIGGCSHFDGSEYCGRKVIAWHSVQRSRALKAIAQGVKVFGFNSSANGTKSKINEPLDFALIGNRQASTFPGFCAKHDSEKFHHIELGLLTANYRTALATSYRAQCYETVIHSNAALFLNWINEIPKFNFPFYKDSFKETVDNMSWYAGYGWELKKILENILQRKSSRKFLYYCCIFDKQLPFAGTGSFCIETDFWGRKLQKFNDFRKFNYAQVSVIP